MRQVLVVVHRWAGLFTALFLFVAGATGALIAWDHELDEWLNPHLFEAASGGQGTPQAPLDLARQVEAADPRLHVTYLPLSIEPGHALGLFVSPRIDPASGKPYALGFNQVAVDPVSGVQQGRREWGAISLSRENLLPFLYKLHYSLHIPDVGAVELGLWVMGIVSVVWILDCVVALWISFPNLRSWRKSFSFRFGQGGAKLNFDLHRSGGVWVWLLLLMLAITSVSMNLGREIMRPVVSLFSPVTPTPFEQRVPQLPDAPLTPRLSREQILPLAEAEARRRGWQVPAGSLFYAEQYGFYGVAFHAPGHDHADGDLGPPWLYFDGDSGAYIGDQVPGTGSAGDLFMQLQFPLHSGRILGFGGRLIISIMGLVVAMLSVTGFIIWLRKRRAHRFTRDLGRA